MEPATKLAGALHTDTKDQFRERMAVARSTMGDGSTKEAYLRTSIAGPFVPARAATTVVYRAEPIMFERAGDGSSLGPGCTRACGGGGRSSRAVL